MANLFFAGEKATKEEAKKSLMEHIEKNWTGTFYADFHTDGGGVLIRAIIEVEHPGEELDQEFRGKFPAKWLGWRLVLLKVTLGYIDAFIK